MIRAITTEVEGHGVGLFGANHLKGLIEGLKEHPKGDEFEVLPINMSPGITVANRKAMEENGYHHARAQYNHHHVPRLFVPGNEIDAATAWDMASKAIAHHQRQQLGIPEDGRVAQLEAETEADLTLTR